MKKQKQQKQIKQWQQEYSDVDDNQILDIQLPPSSDDEQQQNIIQQQQQQQQQEEIEIPINKEQNLEQEQEIKKTKKIEWLDSDIENLDDIESDEEEIPEEEIDHDKKTIFVQGLPLKITDKEINDYFSQFGQIVQIDVPRNYGSQLTKRRAFIEFLSIIDAQQISQMNLELKGCVLKCTIGLQTQKNQKKQNSRERSRSNSQ